MAESKRLPAPPPDRVVPPSRPEKTPAALAWFALLAVLAMAALALPFGTALLLGALLAFTLEPAYTRAASHTRRSSSAAVATVLLTGVIVTGALAGFVSVFIARTVQLATTMRQDLRSGGPMATWIDSVIRWTSQFGVNSDMIRTRLESSAGEMASRAGSLAAALASSTFATLLGIFFALLTMYVVLRHWQRIVAALIAISPLEPRHTQELLEEFRRVGRTTMTGTVITGLIQGGLAALGYWVTGVPYPFFFGVATAFASLLPAVGTLLVWVPAGLYLIATDHLAKGIVELTWGALVVVGVSDYVVRPRVVREESMPTLLVFISLFGGLEMLGLPGLIVGPLVMGLSLSVLRLYARQRTGGKNL